MAFLQASMGGGSSSLAELDDTNIATPQDGDLLVYDAESSKWINSASTVSVTFTIHGAKEDTISIRDSNDALIGSCVFGTGATSGTFTTTLASLYTDIWTLASSISGKTFYVSVTSDPSQTLYARPIRSAIWYGFEDTTITLNSYYSDQGGSADMRLTMTRRTNDIMFAATNLTGIAGRSGSIFFIAPTGVTSVTVKIEGSLNTTTENENYSDIKLIGTTAIQKNYPATFQTTLKSIYGNTGAHDLASKQTLAISNVPYVTIGMRVYWCNVTMYLKELYFD